MATQSMTNPEELYEAAASATLSVITPKGYNTLFTVRDTEVSELVKKIAFLEVKFEELGYKPQPAKTFGAKEQKPVEYTDYLCPVCGSKVIKGVTKNGKLKEECSMRKFDYATQTASGCTYIKWL